MCFSIDALLDCREVEELEEHGACGALDVVGLRVHLAAEVLTGLQNLLEQPTPHRQDCADGPLFGLQDSTAWSHDPRSEAHTAAGHTRMEAQIGALHYA